MSIPKALVLGITSPSLSAGPEYPPLDGRLIMQSKNESVEGVAFVSGIQGVIATTFMVAVVTPKTGENRLKPVCGSAAIATPLDTLLIKEPTLNWRVS
jgi:hypothetical protein